MGSITKLDRLPMDSSLEALRTLRDAWDSVEAYHVSAKIYKFICKITYDVLLIIGIATTVLSLMELMYQVDARVNKIFSCIYRISICEPQSVVLRIEKTEFSDLSEFLWHCNSDLCWIYQSSREVAAVTNGRVFYPVGGECTV